MKKLTILAAVGTCFLATAGLSQEQQQDAASVEASAAESEQAEMTEEEARMQEVQCRSEPVTGSRTRVNRTCMTRAEWRALERRSRENVDELQGRGSGGYVCQQDAFGGCS